MKKSVIILLVLALALCATVALAQGGPGGPGGQNRRGGNNAASLSMAVAPPPAAMIDSIADNLQLTSDQKTKLSAILTKADETLRPLRQKSGQTAIALRDAVLDSNYDAQKVAQLLADAQKADAAVITAEMQTWDQIRPVLSADQLNKLKAANGRRMGGNRGQRGPAPGAPPAPAPAPDDAAPGQ